MPANDDQDITPGELRRWLLRNDQRLDRIESKVGTLDSDIRDRLDRIDRVSYREWDDARKADKAFAEETRAIATSARAWVWAMFAVVVGALLTNAVALVTR